MTGSHACLENLRVTRTYKDAMAPQRGGTTASFVTTVCAL